MEIKKRKKQKISLDSFETDKDEILKLATSDNLKTRLAIAKNKNATPEALILLLDDTEYEVYHAAIKNPNINKTVFDFVTKKLDKVSNSFYIKFSKNESFKKEWIIEYIDFLTGLGNASNIVFTFLDDRKFYDTDDEWLEIYNRIKEKISLDYLKQLPLGSYWTSFFQYPTENYSEKIILSILEDFGDLISEFNKGNFNFIMNTPMETHNVALKIFKLTNNIEYAPKEAKDIFLF